MKKDFSYSMHFKKEGLTFDVIMEEILFTYIDNLINSKYNLRHYEEL